MVPKEGIFTKDMHHSGPSIATATATAASTVGPTATSAEAGGTGEATTGPGAAGGGLQAYEKTLRSIKFVIGDYLDIAIISTTPGFSPLPSLQRRQHNTGGGPIRHQGGLRSGRQDGGRGFGPKPFVDRLAGRLGGFGHNGHGHGQGMGGRRGHIGLDVQNEPSWKGRGRGR